MSNAPFPYESLESCPDCGALSRVGTVRCPECGRFHANIHVREEATVEDARREARTRQNLEVDPSFYSLDPSATIEIDSDEEMEDVSRPWDGGSTDFRFEEE